MLDSWIANEGRVGGIAKRTNLFFKYNLSLQKMGWSPLFPSLFLSNTSHKLLIYDKIGEGESSRYNKSDVTLL